jgi:hypothetical protein
LRPRRDERPDERRNHRPRQAAYSWRSLSRFDRAGHYCG